MSAVIGWILFIAVSILILAAGISQYGAVVKECSREEMEKKYGRELDSWKWAALHPHLQVKFIGYTDEEMEVKEYK